MPWCANIHNLVKAGAKGLKWSRVNKTLVDELMSLERVDGFDRLHRTYRLLNELGESLERAEQIAIASYTIGLSFAIRTIIVCKQMKKASLSSLLHYHPNFTMIQNC